MWKNSGNNKYYRSQRRSSYIATLVKVAAWAKSDDSEDNLCLDSDSCLSSREMLTGSKKTSELQNYGCAEMSILLLGEVVRSFWCSWTRCDWSFEPKTQGNSS